jgi:D-alanyl-D-alanine dipeptidase
MKKNVGFLLIYLSLTISGINSAIALPKGFIYLDQIDDSIQSDLSLCTEKNFMGKPARGYYKNRAICTRQAAIALSKAQKEFLKHGLSLVVLDAYRPTRAVDHFKEWAHDLSDQKTKAKYYPNTPKEALLSVFIAKRSSHSRGSTFDVKLIDAKTGQDVDFGPDYFGEESYTVSNKITPKQQERRLFLKKIMEKQGFKNYWREFWHYTLINEPFKTQYFDFPVK